MITDRKWLKEYSYKTIYSYESWLYLVEFFEKYVVITEDFLDQLNYVANSSDMDLESLTVMFRTLLQGGAK